MGKITRSIFSLTILCFFINNCGVLENGYINEYGNYVPKNPNFTLKNKNNTTPKLLDTLAVYKMYEMYNGGKKYDLNFNKKNNVYLKFFGNGRYINFTVRLKDDLGNLNSIHESDLNPIISDKGYYYICDEKNIKIESFVYGDGQGHYVVSDYILDDRGETLTMQDKYLKIIYRKENTPISWNKYKADW